MKNEETKEMKTMKIYANDYERFEEIAEDFEKKHGVRPSKLQLMRLLIIEKCEAIRNQ